MASLSNIASAQSVPVPIIALARPPCSFIKVTMQTVRVSHQHLQQELAGQEVHQDELYIDLLSRVIDFAVDFVIRHLMKKILFHE